MNELPRNPHDKSVSRLKTELQCQVLAPGEISTASIILARMELLQQGFNEGQQSIIDAKWKKIPSVERIECWVFDEWWRIKGNITSINNEARRLHRWIQEE